MPFALLVLH